VHKDSFLLRHIRDLINRGVAGSFQLRAVEVGTEPELVDQTWGGIVSDLLQWSTAVTQGAKVLSDLSGDFSLGISTALPNPDWVAETAAAPASDSTFGSLKLSPKRLSAKTVASSQLLVSSPEAESVIRADLGKALSRLVDGAVFYGTGGLQPLGIKNHPNTNKVTTGLSWDSVCQLESLCLWAGINAEAYGEITSPEVRRQFKITAAPGVTGPIWEHMVWPLSSSVISTPEVFAGCWDACMIGIWGMEITVNPFSLADRGQVEISGHMFADVGFRYPTAFGVMS
jgi:hypothetical protein